MQDDLRQTRPNGVIGHIGAKHKISDGASAGDFCVDL